jgi:SAM-dependent methyltransferase
MNSPDGKAILATVRDGDYAHPGEEAAIERAAALVDRAGVRRVIDVGCGRGGTAAWFHQRGWGEVVGVDIDAQSIEYARSRYPGVSFRQADVAELERLGLGAFDMACLFTAYYAFPDQRGALHQISAICAPGARLLLMDYTRPGGATVPRVLGREIGEPVVLDTLVADLLAEGWHDIQTSDWTPRFITWYQGLLARIAGHRSDIVAAWGPEWYDYVEHWYGALAEALEQGRLGGAAVTAVR